MSDEEPKQSAVRPGPLPPTTLVKQACGAFNGMGEPCTHPIVARSLEAFLEARTDHLTWIHGVFFLPEGEP